jgi:hypothetical protein
VRDGIPLNVAPHYAHTDGRLGAAEVVIAIG